MPRIQAISASNISCVRGENTLFANLELAVNTGECLHVTGPNGSGKTSLLRILAGINHSETGEVLCDGEPTSDNLSYLDTCA